MRILCFGDSNTYGYDPRGYLGGRYDARDRWVDLVAEQTGHTFINAGMNGREIPRNRSEFQKLQEAESLLVMLGTNDLLQGASAAETALRMERFLIFLLPCYDKILLVAPPPMKRGTWVDTDDLVAESISLAEAYRTVAKKLHIPFVDTQNWNIDLAFDGVHFTEAGHHTFAEKPGKGLRL